MSDEPVTAEQVARLGVELDASHDGYKFADLRTNWSLLGAMYGGHVDLTLMFREDGMLAACDLDATTYGDDGSEVVTDTELTIPLPKTMGEFTRLCAALGVPLKEST